MLLMKVFRPRSIAKYQETWMKNKERNFMALTRGFGRILYLCERKVERLEICIAYKMWQQCKHLQQEIPLSSKMK
jgi:hypothetical protein